MYDDGGDYSVFEAIIATTSTIVSLIAVIICFNPVMDYFAWLLGGLPSNPYSQAVMPLFKWYHVIVIGAAIASFIWLWKVVIRKIRYTRPSQRDLW